MKKFLLGCGLALAIGMLLTAGAGAVRAEDRGAFTNSSDLSRAQDILLGDGYLSAGSFTPGTMDEATRSALSAYQSVHALNHRGDLDDETFTSLTSHEISYPWGDAEEVAETAPEPASPAPVARLAEAPPVPAPAPATAEIREAPAPAVSPVEPARAPAQPARKMPATGSPLPLLAISGLALLGAGALLLRQHAA